MKSPRVFVVQPVYDEALTELRSVADVEVFPHADRMMRKDEIVEAVQRNDYLFTLGDTVIDADIISANPDLKIVATMAIYPTTVDMEAPGSITLGWPSTSEKPRPERLFRITPVLPATKPLPNPAERLWI